GVGSWTAALDSGRLAQQHGSGRGFHDEGKAAVAVDRDHHWDGQPRLKPLGLGIECLAELHDIHAALAQGRPYRRTGVGLPRLDLQLYVSVDLLCHGKTPVGSAPRGRMSARLRLPGLNQAFSTWLNSSSTGVERPNIITATRSRFLS